LCVRESWTAFLAFFFFFFVSDWADLERFDWAGMKGFDAMAAGSVLKKDWWSLLVSSLGWRRLYSGPRTERLGHHNRS
jgi:hypothetical protein